MRCSRGRLILPARNIKASNFPATSTTTSIATRKGRSASTLKSIASSCVSEVDGGANSVGGCFVAANQGPFPADRRKQRGRSSPGVGGSTYACR